MKRSTLHRGVLPARPRAGLRAGILGVLAFGWALLDAPTALASNADGFEHTRLHLTAGALGHHVSSGDGGSIVRTVVGLAIVIAVIYGLAWIVRQTKAAKNPTKGTGLEQIASLPLGTNRSVSLVRVGSELHLLGIAESGVTGIRTFSEDEAVAFGLPVPAPGEITGEPAQPPLTRAVDTLRRMTAR